MKWLKEKIRNTNFNTILDIVLDLLFYISVLGILAAILIMTWANFLLGVRLLVTFMLLLVVTFIVVFLTGKEKEDNGK